MNTRRGFLRTLLAAGAGFSILPSAVTYARAWKPVKPILPVYFVSAELVTATMLKNALDEVTLHPLAFIGYNVRCDEHTGLSIVETKLWNGVEVKTRISIVS